MELVEIILGIIGCIICLVIWFAIIYNIASSLRR